MSFYNLQNYFDYNDAIMYEGRKGTPDDPYVNIEESIYINQNNKAILTEVPDVSNRIVVAGNSVTWIETDGIPTENQYKVDYVNGVVTFHSSRKGLTLQFQYMGTGRKYTPASRIWTKRDGVSVTETLQDFVDRAEQNSSIVFKPPVASFSDISTTYPTPENGWTTRTIDEGKLYRYDSGSATWKWIDTITTSAYDVLLNKTETLTTNVNTINQNISTVTAQLADNVQQINELENSKMEKYTTDISINQINKNLGKFDQTYMTEEFLQQITGITPVNAIPTRDSITRSRIADMAVDASNLMFIKKSDNIFNINTAIKGYSASGTTGQLVVNSTYYVSDYIYAKPNQEYSFNNITRWVAYDEALNFISSGTSSPFTTPPNTFYLRVNTTIYVVADAQLNLGSTLLAFDEFKETLSGAYGINVEPSNKTVGEKAITRDAVTPISAKFFKKPNNLYNKNYVQELTTINDTGQEIAHATYCLTKGYIPVTPNAIYSKSANAITVAYYANNLIWGKTVALNISTENFTTPKWAHYMRVACNPAIIDTLMINEGETLLTHDDYRFEIQSTDEFPLIINKAIISSELGNQWIEEQIVTLTPSLGVTVAELTTPAVIDLIELATDKQKTELQLYIKEGGIYNLLEVSTPTGNVPMTIENLITYGSSIIEFITANSDTSAYKICAKNLNCAEGVKIVVNNTDTVETNINCKVVGRSYETA